MKRYSRVWQSMGYSFAKYITLGTWYKETTKVCIDSYKEKFTIQRFIKG